MSATRTPAFAATAFHANGQTTTLGFPKEAGKPNDQSAAGFLAMLRAQSLMADVVKVEIFDNKGSKGVVATAAA